MPGFQLLNLMDGRPRSLPFFSDQVFESIVAFLRKVENQGGWPNTLAIAKVVFLDTGNPATMGPRGPAHPAHLTEALQKMDWHEAK